MCNYGHSDQEHPVRALELFRRAAAAGSHLGMYNMGACAYHGIGTSRDRSAARLWWLKGAEMGETDCFNALSTLH
jgi:TPR repeat protein